MARRGKSKVDKPASLGITIEGEGLSLETVPVRKLVALLEAASQLVEAIAEDAGVEPPVLSLVQVHSSAPFYRLQAPSDGRPLLNTATKLMRTRGQGASAPVARGLRRFYGATADIGAARIKPDKSGKFVLAAPIEKKAEFVVEETVDIYGRVVGVFLKNEHPVVELKPEQGGRRELRATPELASLAAQLWRKQVHAGVTVCIDDANAPGVLESIEPFESGDVMSVLDEVRQKLDAAGIAFDALAALGDE